MEDSKIDGILNLIEPLPTLQARGDSRVNLGVPHLMSAAVFSRRVRDLELEHAGEEFGEFWHEIYANASGAVFISVAALESYANELFIDHKIIFPELRETVMAKLCELCEQKPILEKYEFALLLKEGLAFNRGSCPYQDVSAIIKLRNALTHFRPEWFSAQEEHAKLSSLLKHKATMSPFISDPEPLFPQGWASHATIKWIVKSTLEFILEFEKRANIEQRMAMFERRFSEL